jgi:hypothetical protein
MKELQELTEILYSLDNCLFRLGKTDIYECLSLSRMIRKSLALEDLMKEIDGTPSLEQRIKDRLSYEKKVA